MGTIEWMSTRHEEVAALPLALKHNLAENWRSVPDRAPRQPALNQRPVRLPPQSRSVLAIAAHIPSSEIGSGYFQEPTHKSYSANVVTIASWFPARADPTSAGNCYAQSSA